MKKLLIIPLIAIMLCGCIDIRLGYDYYEYVDLDGNEGKADDCWKSYGNMICELEDGTEIKVKRFKGVNKQ